MTGADPGAVHVIRYPVITEPRRSAEAQNSTVPGRRPDGLASLRNGLPGTSGVVNDGQLGSDGGPLPAAFEASTVQVYSLPRLRFSTINGDWSPDPLRVAPPGELQVAV